MVNSSPVNVFSTEDCSVSQEQWQMEIQLEFREKPLPVNLVVISAFLRFFCCMMLVIYGGSTFVDQEMLQLLFNKC